MNMFTTLFFHRKTIAATLTLVCFFSIIILAAFFPNPEDMILQQSAGRSDVVVANNDTCRTIDTYLQQLEKDKNFSGVLLIVKDGKKIFSKGYGWADKERKIALTPATIISMGSITKAFTAAAILKLTEQQRLSLSDSLKNFFPDAPPDKANITIHQLLTHSSGFQEILQGDKGDYEKIETKEYVQRAFAEPLAFQPGKKAIYTNVGMSILGIIIEKVSGLRYEEYLKQHLFEPVGIKRISYCYPLAHTDTIAVGYKNSLLWGTHQERFSKAGGGPYWNLKANGGLEASLNDMFLWVNALSDYKVLSERSVQTMFTPHVQEEGYNGTSFFGYGCNVSKSRRGTKLIDNGGSNGIYFARLIRLPEEGLIFYMATNESSVSCNIVLPNVTQLYFQGKIEQDMFARQQEFEHPLSKSIYELVSNQNTADLAGELNKHKINVADDMILLEVGQRLMREQRADKALILYTYYVAKFPKIVVAWNDLGDTYRLLGDKTRAMECYKKALQLRPGNPRAKENLEALERK